MSIFKKLILKSHIILLLCSFSFKCEKGNKTTIEVFFYNNSRGAYTLPYEMIVEQYTKHCIIKNEKVVNKICKEIIQAEKKILSKTYFQSCNYVIKCSNYNGKTYIVGFNNDYNIIHINGESFEVKTTLLNLIKKHCLCKWK